MLVLFFLLIHNNSFIYSENSIFCYIDFKYFFKLNTYPVQVRCMIQGARGWCTRMTQRDGTGREVEEGFRMGKSSTPVVD